MIRDDYFESVLKEASAGADCRWEWKILQTIEEAIAKYLCEGDWQSFVDATQLAIGDSLEPYTN